MNEERRVLSGAGLRRLTREDREKLDELLCSTLQREMPEVRYPMASSRVLRKALWPEVERYLAQLLASIMLIDGRPMTEEEAYQLADDFCGQGWR
ncbi:MAG: hypothetical protein L0170_18370 [Acidobacteria bacterium]|nr:hypothetical protein [Acidobacteriota bacterium]